MADVGKAEGCKIDPAFIFSNRQTAGRGKRMIPCQKEYAFIVPLSIPRVCSQAWITTS